MKKVRFLATGYKTLTKGKVYDVLEETTYKDSKFYRVKDDTGQVGGWYRHNFEIVTENDKLSLKEKKDLIHKLIHDLQDEGYQPQIVSEKGLYTQIDFIKTERL